jgi:hypothetical protein
VPRFTYMSSCNHIHYDQRCGVSTAGFSHTGNVSAESGNDITLDGASASGLTFTGSFCRPTGMVDFRMVVAQSGDVLTLSLPFATPVLGTNVQAFAGCDRKIDGDCANTYDNVLEFGGFAFVPDRNPFADGLDSG